MQLSVLDPSIATESRRSETITGLFDRRIVSNQDDTSCQMVLSDDLRGSHLDGHGVPLSAHAHGHFPNYFQSLRTCFSDFKPKFLLNFTISFIFSIFNFTVMDELRSLDFLVKLSGQSFEKQLREAVRMILNISDPLS